MKKNFRHTGLVSFTSVALASSLIAPTHAVVPLVNPLAAGAGHSLFISNPVSSPTIVMQGFFPQNIVRGMGYGAEGGVKVLGSIPPSGSPPQNYLSPRTVGCRAASPPPPLGDYPLGLVVQVAAAIGHSVALRSNGDVVTFGSGHSRALGYGTTDDFDCPSYFSAPVPLNPVGVRPTPVWAVAAGWDTTFALQGTSPGYSIIKAWGYSGWGQVGNGKPIGTAYPVPDCVRNNVYPLGSCLYPVVSVAAGDQHSAAVTTDGKVHTWGNNSLGQLGQPGAMRSYALVVPGIDNVVSVSASGFVTFALKQDGTVWCWGQFQNEYAPLPWLSCGPTPTKVPNLTGVTSIAAGRNHALAITVDGRIWGWGHNNDGAVGNPTATFTLTPVLVNVPGFAVAIAAGWLHSLAHTADGKTWAWGNNSSGKLGDGTNINRFSPVQVLP